MPGSYRRRPNPTKGHRTKGRQDVEAQLSLVQLSDPWPQRGTAAAKAGSDPLAGVLGQGDGPAVRPDPTASTLVSDSGR